MSPSPEQQALIEAIASALQADPQVEAAWLAGSLGRGGGDAYSDVDVLALTPAGQGGEAGRRYAADVGAIAPAVLVMPLFGARVVSVVTADWRRFDLSFAEPDDLVRYDADRLRPLFNRGDRSPPRGNTPPYEPSAEAVLALVNEFLRVLGLAPVAFGRQEWILALTGTELLRRLTLDLMLEENSVGPAERGGALRRNPLLSAEQRQELEGLSPVAADPDSLLAFNREIAAVFLPRARRLAQRTGAPWPEAFEAATRRHLQSRLGLTLA